MPQFRDFLRRFRPAGAPGAARAAVPVDHGRELANELLPVLSLLDGTDTECARILADSRLESERMRSAARASAADIAAVASARAISARDQAAREVLDAARAQADDIVSAARRQAAAVSELAMDRVPVLTDRAIGLITGLRTP